YARTIAPAILDAYERLHKRPDRKAVVVLNGRNCTGCYSVVTLETQSQVKQMVQLTFCHTCGSILHIPSLLGLNEDK
ncbi:MAG: hypothetical protein HQL31_09745, partial [Planctomycetes bacterium]|nr:hypothetical protein [Planctomycetota bacterium]